MTFPCLTCRQELEDSYRSCPSCSTEVSDFVREYSKKPVNNTYELLARIGGGGMGTVFLVRHLIFDTKFVLKMMKSAIQDSPGLQKRFLREALLSRKVHHPHVASVIDAARLPDGSMYIISEFIEGTPLSVAIDEAGRLPFERCLNIAGQVLDGLQAIHSAALVHRDISPDNIMLSRDARKATIIDLGIAKEIGHSSLTEELVFVGKLRYASPEQLRNEAGLPVDARADIYSFGILLYEMLTGSVPFDAPTAGQLVALHLFEPPPPLPAGVAPPHVEKLIHRCLAKSRDARYGDAASVKAALEAPQAVLRPAGTTIAIESPAAPAVVPAVVPGRRSWHRVVTYSALLAAALVLVAIFLLNNRSTAREIPMPASVLPPLRIYSAVTEIVPGVRVNADDIVEELTSRGYELSRGPTFDEGEYAVDGGGLSIALRSFERPVRREGARIRIFFADGAVSEIRNLEGGAVLQRGLLEPKLLASVEVPLDVSKLKPSFTRFAVQQLSDRMGSDNTAFRGGAVYSTLDTLMQRSAERSLERGLERLRPKLRGAIITLDPHERTIKAMAGPVETPRRVGTIFLPFIYTAAMEGATPESPLTAATMLDDSPINVQSAAEEWRPANDDNAFRGKVSVRQALVQSRNVPAVRVAVALGIPNLAASAKRFGLEMPPTLGDAILGEFTATPLQVANAYATLAASGERVSASAIGPIFGSDGKEVNWGGTTVRATTPEVSYITNNVLKDVLDYGAAQQVRSLGFRRPFAGKSGSSKERTDAWFVAYSPRILSLVWIGSDDEGHPELTGRTTCVPIWAEHMSAIASLVPNADWHRPELVVSAEIDPQSGQLATAECPVTFSELFLRGAEPTDVCDRHTHALSEPKPAPPPRTADSKKDEEFRKLLKRVFGDDPKTSGGDAHVYSAVPPGGTKAEEIDRAIPRYPAVARQNGTEGQVVVRGIVRTNGTIDSLEIIKTLPDGLGESALEAVAKWRFRPATYKGQPIAVYYSVTVNFHLTVE